MSEEMTSSVQQNQQILKLELLGIGSKRYLAFLKNLKSALETLQLDIPINEIKDIHQILEYDIIGIPALCINGRFYFQTDVPSTEELLDVLKQAIFAPK
jgi:hypothetical protein